MIKIIDFSDWEVYDGFSEGSGRSEKIWLKSKDGQIGLFKFPKEDSETKKITTEHISEHLSYQLGIKLDVSTSKVDIGMYDGRIGSMSYFVCEDNEVLKEGIEFISGKFPKYDTEKLINTEDETYYCINHIFTAMPKVVSRETMIEMMLFDFLIGNTDRHHSNWAFLVKTTVGKSFEIRIKQCPLYDNGSSLCCFVNDNQLEDMLDERKNRFNALVDSKSLSTIRISGASKKRPTHREMARYLLQQYPISKTIAIKFLESLDENTINNILSEYPNEILEARKKELIKRYLLKKLEILKTLLEEVNNDESFK